MRPGPRSVKCETVTLPGVPRREVTPRDRKVGSWGGTCFHRGRTCHMLGSLCLSSRGALLAPGARRVPRPAGWQVPHCWGSVACLGTQGQWTSFLPPAHISGQSHALHCHPPESQLMTPAAEFGGAGAAPLTPPLKPRPRGCQLLSKGRLLVWLSRGPHPPGLPLPVLGPVLCLQAWGVCGGCPRAGGNSDFIFQMGTLSLTGSHIILMAEEPECSPVTLGLLPVVRLWASYCLPHCPQR